MAIKVNGEERKYKLLHNGIELDKGYHNGEVLIYNKATPYYVNFTDYPLQEVSTDGNSDYNIRTNAADYYIDVLRNPDSGYGIVVAKAVLPTNNCNKVRVKYTAYNGVDRQICGTYVDAVSSYITFYCSGNTFELTMRVVNDNSGYWATMTISEVYFYYE